MKSAGNTTSQLSAAQSSLSNVLRRKAKAARQSYDKKNEKQKRRIYWMVYTLFFLVIGLCVFGPLFASGKGFINSIDGLSQQYSNFVSKGLLLREVAYGFLDGEGLSFPLYSLYQGYGDAIWYFGDPFQYLSVFCPVAYSEYLFNALVIVRLWLMGWSFSIMCRHLQSNGRKAILMGALIYVFSSFGFQAVLQTIFLNQAIIFPFVILGVERLISFHKPVFFILSLTIALYAVGVYSVYMMLFLTAAYGLIRIIPKAQKKIKSIVFFGFCFAACSGVAFLVALPAIAPQLENLFSQDRFSVNYATTLLYTFEYYQSIFGGFAGHYWAERDWFFGYGGVAFLACLIMFARRKSESNLKYMFVALVVFLLFPFFGFMLNGFSYVVNRWIWAFALLVAYIVVRMVPRLNNLTPGELKYAGWGLGVYCILVLVLPDARTESTLTQIAIALLTYFLILGANRGLPFKTQIKEIFPAGIAVCVVASLMFNWYFLLSPQEEGWSERLIDTGFSAKMLTTSSPNQLVKSEGEQTSYRYDKTFDVCRYQGGVGLNSSQVQRLQGVDYYSSFYNNYVDSFHSELALSGTSQPMIYQSLNSRSALQRLMGVNNVLMRDSENLQQPYGSKDSATSMVGYDGECYTLYELSNALPIAFTYKYSIDKSTYQGMNPLEKQGALLQGVVLEDDVDSIGKADIKSTNTELSYTVTSNDGEVEIGEDVIKVKKAWSSITLSFVSPTDSETYLYVQNLLLDPYNERETYSETEWNYLSAYEQNKIKASDDKSKGISSFAIGISSDNGTQTFNTFTNESHLYGAKDTWLWNLGYSQQKLKSVTLTFPNAGEYSFSDFSIYRENMEYFDEMVDDLREDPVESIEFNGREVSCEVDVSQREIVYFSIPYSQYWNAEVNGEEINVIRANTAFMAIEVAEGKSDIILRYTPPYHIWFGMSLLGCVIIVVICFCIKDGLFNRFRIERIGHRKE